MVPKASLREKSFISKVLVIHEQISTDKTDRKEHTLHS